jgi:preprotein translocase subunit SecF
MHNQQQRHHLKTNNIISKLAVIVLSIVLLTGISLVPALQIGVNGQVQQPQQQKQVGLSQVIKQIAQQVVTANPGTNAAQVEQILVQLAKQTAQTASKEQAIQEIRQISSQVTTYPFGTVSQSLSSICKTISFW